MRENLRKIFAVCRDGAAYTPNSWEREITAPFQDALKRRHAAINHLLDIFSRRTEITVGLAGLLRIVCRAQGISEKLKTVLS